MATLNSFGVRKTNRAIFFTVILWIVALGAGFYFYARKERSNLVRELELVTKQKNALNYQRDEVMKAVAPLKKEIEHLQTVILKEKRVHESQPTQPAGTPPAALKIEKSASEEKVNKPLPESNPTAKDRILDTEKGLTRLKEYVKSLEEEKASLKEKAYHLKLKLDEKEREVGILSSDNTGLKDSFPKVLQAKNKLEAEFATAADSLEKVKNELSQKEQQVASLGKAKQVLENKVDELNDKLAVFSNTTTDLERQLAHYRQEKSFLEKELLKAKEELLKQNDSAEPWAKKNAGLTEALEVKEKQVKSISEELSQVKESKRNLEVELGELKLAKIANENQISQLNARVSESTISYDNLKSTVSQLSNLLTKKEVEISERQREIALMKEQLDNLVKEKNTLLAALDEKEKAANSLNASLSRMGSQVVILQEQLAAPNRLQSKTLEQLDQLTTVSNFLQERISGISKELDTIHTQADLDKQKAEDLRKKVELTLDIDREDGDASPFDSK